MTVFVDYARYYDLLYRDKDYGAEARYIDTLIQKYAPGSKSILDLGCGTGSHVVQLLKNGYSVHGVDISEEMLTIARERHDLDKDRERINFSQGDIREIRLRQKFDVVISLFHVMSYLPTNNDIKAAISSAREHLTPNGIFVFDYWYGPGVLSEQPSVRIKRFEDEQLEVTRIAEPIIHHRENLVDVNYHIFIKNKITNKYHEINETHRMRYLFEPELRELLQQVGFELVDTMGWMEQDQPRHDTWNACLIARIL